MKKTIIEIYALLVCLGAMAALSISMGLFIYNTISLVKPGLTVSNYQYENHQSNNNYWRYQTDTQAGGFPLNLKNNNKPINRPAENKLTQQRLDSYQSVIDAEVRNALKDLISEFIIILMSSILFFVHWRFVLHKNNNALSAKNEEHS